MIETLSDIQSSLSLTELNSFQLYQLQSMLNIAVPQVNVDVTGSINQSTNKAMFIFKQRNKLNFPHTISPKTIKLLEYAITSQDVLDIPTFNLLSFFRTKLSYLPSSSFYVSFFISTLKHFNFTSKEIITILLSTMDYESKGYTELVSYKRGVRTPSSEYHLTYQPKGLIKLFSKDQYTLYTHLSNNIVDLRNSPYSLTSLCIAFFISCLYFKNNKLDKSAQELNFRSVVKHFDYTYNSWTPRYRNWIQTQNLLYA